MTTVRFKMVYFITCIGNYCKQRSYKATEFEAHEYPETTDYIMCCYVFSSACLVKVSGI